MVFELLGVVLWVAQRWLRDHQTVSQVLGLRAWWVTRWGAAQVLGLQGGSSSSSPSSFSTRAWVSVSFWAPGHDVVMFPHREAQVPRYGWRLFCHCHFIVCPPHGSSSGTGVVVILFNKGTSEGRLGSCPGSALSLLCDLGWTPALLCFSFSGGSLGSLHWGMPGAQTPTWGLTWLGMASRGSQRATGLALKRTSHASPGFPGWQWQPLARVDPAPLGIFLKGVGRGWAEPVHSWLDHDEADQGWPGWRLSGKSSQSTVLEGLSHFSFPCWRQQKCLSWQDCSEVQLAFRDTARVCAAESFPPMWRAFWGWGLGQRWFLGGAGGWGPRSGTVVDCPGEDVCFIICFGLSWGLTLRNFHVGVIYIQ